MVGFHATRKKARVVSRATGAVKQDRLCVEDGNGAGRLSAKTAHQGRISYWHFALTSAPILFGLATAGPLVLVSFCGHFVVLPHSQQIDRHLVQFVHRVCRIEQRRVESGDFFNGF
jgi:hypothetical protein